jgi:hypothetical protein
MRYAVSRRSLCESFLLFVGMLPVGHIRKAHAARTSVGLNCVTNDGANPLRHFAINLTPGNNGWSQSEPGSTSDIFKTKSGNYVTVANTTSLRKNDSKNTVVAVLRNFNPSTGSQGDSGNDGEALETARTFQWTVDIIVP